MKTALLDMPKNRWAVSLAIAAALVSLPIFVLWAVVQTDWFESKLRQRIVSTLEEATGGTAEIQEVSFSLVDIGIRISKLTVRGTEPPSHPPLLLVPRVRMQIGLDSLLRRRLSLRSLELKSPKVQISVAPDGSSNVPRPPRRAGLFDLVIGDFKLDRGSIVWNGSLYNVSLVSKDVDIHTEFEEERGRYTARLRLGDSLADVGDRRPIVSEAEAELLLYQDRIEIPRIRLALGETELSATGRVDGWQRPNANFQIVASVALKPLAEWLQQPAVQSGSAKVTAEVRWHGATEALAYSGELAVSDAAVRSGPVSITGISASGNFSGDRSNLSVLPLEFSALDRDFAASLTVGNLRGDGAPQLDFTCEVEALELESLFGAVNSERWAADSLPWASQIHASVTVHGPLGELDAGLSLVLESSEFSAPGRIPVEGLIDLNYSSREQSAALSQLDLSTAASRVRANGIISAQSASRLRLTATVTTLEDVLAGLRLRDPDLTAATMPLEVNGRAAVEGLLTAKLFAAAAPELRFQGQVEAEKVRVLDYDLERMEGHVNYSPNEVRVSNARLSDGQGNAALTLTLPLENGRLVAPREPLFAQVELENLEAQRLLATAGFHTPVSGILDSQIRLEGSLSQPRGATEIVIRSGKVGETPFDEVSAAIDFTETQLSIKSMEMALGEGRIGGAGDYDVPTGEFRVSLSSSNWPFRNLPGLDLDVPALQGALRFDLRGSGKLTPQMDGLEELQLAGGWSAEQLSYGEQTLGNLSGEIETVADEVTLDWRGEMLSGRLEGNANLSLPGPLRGQMQFNELDLTSITSFVGVPIERAAGEMDGSCSFYSQTLSSEDLRVEGVITRLESAVSEIPGSDRDYRIWNPFPMRWSFADQTIRLNRMRLLGDGTDIDVDGTVRLAEPREMNIEIEGTFNLAVVDSFRSDLSAEGSSTVEIQVTGSPQDPSVVGQMQIRDGAVRSQDFPNGLSQMNGQVAFAGRQLSIEEVTASTGGGTVRLSGNALLAEGSASYRLIAEAERVRVRYPESVSSVLNGRLTLSGTGLSSLLSGQVTIHRSSISPDVDLGRMLASLGEPTRTPPSSPVLSNLQLNIQVASVPSLEVETQLIREMETRIDLRVTGTAVQPSLLGAISVTRGEIRFQGSRYTINRGDIEFINPFRLEPVVNFELETRVRDVDVTLFLSGPARKMNLSFRSDPPLQFNELVSLIAIGRAPSQDPVFAAQQTIEQQHFLQAGASTVLGNALSQPVSSRLQRFFGVSRLRVDPQLGGVEADPSARISTEQQITNDLTLIYSYDLSSAQQQVVRVEWAPNRRWSVIFTRDENGLVGGDLLYKKRLH